MDQEPILNAHNKEEHPPMHTKNEVSLSNNFIQEIKQLVVSLA